MQSNIKLACCYGTRPELIKIAPIVRVLREKYPRIEPVLICSGQHQELLAGLDDLFGVSVQKNLEVRNLIGATDSLSSLADTDLIRFDLALRELKPDGILIQGDAASTIFASIAAYHQHIPIFYVEAGLRTFDLQQPFPEEGYRQMTSRLATVLFAPTMTNKQNLLSEHIEKNRIYVVGNTIVDAIKLIGTGLKKEDVTKIVTQSFPWISELKHRKLVIVTLHRRENHPALGKILAALKTISRNRPDLLFVFSVHPSQKIRLPVYRYLKNEPGFKLISPPNYRIFLVLMSYASTLITDSGGIQEEGPSFGIPTLILREKTERIEGVELGWSILAGVDEKKIVENFKKLDRWVRPRGGNPYGDGKASKRIAKIINEYFQ